MVVKSLSFMVMPDANIPDINIKDPETKRIVRQFAALKNIGITDAVKVAVRNEMLREAAKKSLYDRLAPLRARYSAMPDTGLAADKAFFDDLSGDR